MGICGDMAGLQAAGGKVGQWGLLALNMHTCRLSLDTPMGTHSLQTSCGLWRP